MSAAGLLLRGGNVFWPDGILRPADVLITRDTITSVGQQLEVPEATRVVELAGCAILPGLIDAHTHLTHGYETAVSDREAAQGVRAGFPRG